MKDNVALLDAALLGTSSLGLLIALMGVIGIVVSIVFNLSTALPVILIMIGVSLVGFVLIIVLGASVYTEFSKLKSKVGKK